MRVPLVLPHTAVITLKLIHSFCVCSQARHVLSERGAINRQLVERGMHVRVRVYVHVRTYEYGSTARTTTTITAEPERTKSVLAIFMTRSKGGQR